MKKNLIHTILNFFKSVKLTVILIVYMTITSILATLVPQGNEIAFYQQYYHPFISWLILSTGLYDFFRSFLFLGPVALFTINLIVCMLSRFIRELLHKQKKRFGPDIIHLGILLFIVGALLTFFMRQEQFFYMDQGEEVMLAQKYILTLSSFKQIKYPDGRPKKWISEVSVKENDIEIISSFPIEVNKPLEIDGMSVYQASFYDQQYLVLEDTTGKDIQLPEGHPVPGGLNNLFFVKTEDNQFGEKKDRVMFEQWEDNNFVQRYEYSIGSHILNYVIKDKIIRTLSGLQVVVDPGFLPIIISSIAITAGLALTFIQKIKDKKL